MKTRIALFALTAVALVWGSALVAQENKAEEEKKFTATCPVSGKPAVEDSSVKFRGKNVYFCCENCPKAFNADRAKYRAKANRQLLETGQMVQVACPLTGRPMNTETAVTSAGAKFCFCCANCKGKYENATEAEQVDLVFKTPAKGFTLQTECPVSGKKINPEAVVEHEGKKVYFCCENCPKAFQADPKKFISKLPQFRQRRNAAGAGADAPKKAAPKQAAPKKAAALKDADK